MAKEKFIDTYVITTVLNGKTAYVAGWSTRNWDQKKIITSHSPNIDDARECFTEEHAAGIISKLTNAHGRLYQAQRVSIPVSKRHKPLKEEEHELG